jgi:hypothetical protein
VRYSSHDDDDNDDDDDDGTAIGSQQVFTNLSLSEIVGRSVIIHNSLGGGEKVACGIITQHSGTVPILGGDPDGQSAGGGGGGGGVNCCGGGSTCGYEHCPALENLSTPELEGCVRMWELPAGMSYADCSGPGRCARTTFLRMAPIGEPIYIEAILILCRSCRGCG